MAIRVKCAGCGKEFTVADHAQGEKGPCPHCGTFVVVSGKHFTPPTGTPLSQWRPGTAFPAFAGHEGHVHSVVWSSGGTLLLSAGDDGTVRLWDVKSGRQEMCLDGHEGEVHSAAFSPAGDFVLSGGEDARVRLWKVSNGKCARVLEGHRGPVMAVAFCPLGRYGISASMDRTLRVWDLAESRCVKVLKKHKSPVTSLACEPTGEFFLSGGYDKVIRIWRSGKWKQAAKLKGHGGPVLALDVNADGGFVISGSADRTAAIWDLLKRRPVKALKGHQASVDAVALSFDGGLAATGGADWTLRIWDARTGKRRFAIETEEQSITALAFDPESPRLAVADTSGRVRLFDPRTGEHVMTFGGCEDSIPVMCPACKGKMFLPKEFIGREGLCPFCSTRMTATLWSPEESERLYDNAVKAFHGGLLQQAASFFEQAVRCQYDNYDANLRVMDCRGRLAKNLVDSAQYTEAVEMLRISLAVHNRARPWTAETELEARNLAYEAAFLAAKICRYDLHDRDAAKEFCRIAATFQKTPELEDLLAHIDDDTPAPELS